MSSADADGWIFGDPSTFERSDRAMGDRGTTRLYRGVGLAARACRGTVPAVRALDAAEAHSGVYVTSGWLAEKWRLY